MTKMKPPAIDTCIHYSPVILFNLQEREDEHIHVGLTF